MIPEPPAPIERALRLRVVELPAGDVAPFDVESFWNNGFNRGKYWLDGYDGFRFVGRGRNLTHIRPREGTSTSSVATIVIGPGAKHVEIEGASIHCPANADGNKMRGIHCGDAMTTEPVTLKLRDVEFPEPDLTSTWGIFSYNTIEDYEHVTFKLSNLYEHANYGHGNPSRLWVDVEVDGAGAECSKGVCRPGESLWQAGGWYTYRRCTFRNWYQAQSWQGGCGLGALQGPGQSVLIEECDIRAPTEGHANAPVHLRGRCVMLADTDRQYDAIAGVPGEHPGLGWVILRRSIIVAGPGSDNYSVMLGIGSENSWTTNPIVARGILIEHNAIYGERMVAQIGRTKGPLVIRDNNTPGIRMKASDEDVDTRHECMLSVAGEWRLFSAGYTK